MSLFICKARWGDGCGVMAYTGYGDAHECALDGHDGFHVCRCGALGSTSIVQTPTERYRNDTQFNRAANVLAHLLKNGWSREDILSALGVAELLAYDWSSGSSGSLSRHRVERSAPPGRTPYTSGERECG